MMARHWSVLAPLALFAAAACSKPPAPAAVTPVAAPDTAALAAARRDSMAAAAARRDSIAAVARADSLAALARAQAAADSVQAQVNRPTTDTTTINATTGLTATEAATLADVVHFDFDRADLTAEDQATLDRKMQVLAAHPRVTLRIAGNCDERGSEEYNLALGERRAAAAKRYLEAHGVAGDRIAIVSYGKERPLDPGHDEAAWARNRRDDFVVTHGAN
jgi:peptidoglycan-associated lipoprotein